MLQFVNYRMKVTLQDGRTFVGNMLAFDTHMNLVLADCEEYRRTKSKKSPSGFVEQKRPLGLIVLRGDTIVTMSVEAGPPPTDMNKARVPASLQLGPGMGRAAGRGLPVAMPGLAPSGLGGPVRGLGGNMSSNMGQGYNPPQMQAPPGLRPPMHSGPGGMGRGNARFIRMS
ncbi:Sm-like ribonucleo protein [Rozella allomycis CSF55]|uniref:Sm protein B n=1 Tax=Rozella allomycis (strain CSF55) TaxID=988480 RepID=A0A075B298_ROZAC|nr:Like-Sm (LSM) domain-containing protein [Rozella allomycis CSF55]RKP17100.1 Sm-like ribonucleo protein [Rozella allomycis CSF55]|eukprot:EPZ36652.1 Like-Sm (LSM) domain-containing protein [Rozella allomycis CSF55]